MIALFWTLLFCDGSQQVTYINPADRLDATLVYAYVHGSADTLYYFPATELFVCGHWITLEN